MFKFLKELFKTDEQKCKDLIGIVYREDGENPFIKEHQDRKILDVKKGYVKYEYTYCFMYKNPPIIKTCDCSIFLEGLWNCYQISEGDNKNGYIRNY
jgi:hypothetical protein